MAEGPDEHCLLTVFMAALLPVGMPAINSQHEELPYERHWLHHREVERCRQRRPGSS
jgi:hypothetical protein